MGNIKIEPSTPIEDLRKAGIVPDWMAEECEEHGMYEAENILCEWDWEDVSIQHPLFHTAPRRKPQDFRIPLPPHSAVSECR